MAPGHMPTSVFKKENSGVSNSRSLDSGVRLPGFKSLLPHLSDLCDLEQSTHCAPGSSGKWSWYWVWSRELSFHVCSCPGKDPVSNPTASEETFWSSIARVPFWYLWLRNLILAKAILKTLLLAAGLFSLLLFVIMWHCKGWAIWDPGICVCVCACVCVHKLSKKNMLS